MFCIDETAGNLIDELEPTAHLANISQGGEVPDGLHILVRRPDPLHGDLEPVNSIVSLVNLNFSGEKTIPFWLQWERIVQILKKACFRLSDHWMMSSIIFSELLSSGFPGHVATIAFIFLQVNYRCHYAVLCVLFVSLFFVSHH